MLRQGLPSVRRREPAEVGRLRDLCPRPLAAGALHRPQLRPAAHRPGGHPGRLGQHRRSVEVEIYRIGDRNLLPTVRSEDFLGQLSGYAAETIATEKGVKIWTGIARRRSPSSTRTSSRPSRCIEAVGKLEPGVYVMIARPDSGAAPADEDYSARATQWFVVSDLGLTGLQGQGRRARPRALARERRAARQCRDPPRRPQQRGAGDEVDRCRRPCRLRSRPRARRGRQRAGPRRRLDRRAITASSTSARAAFDLTDRGVKGRAAPGAVDAYRLSPSAASTAPARRCS